MDTHKYIKYKIEPNVEDTCTFKTEDDIYGQKEVPNVKLCAYNKSTNDSVEFIFKSVLSYDEVFTSTDGFQTVITLSLFSPIVYETLTQPFTDFTVETGNFWRSSIDGEDHYFEGLKRHYTHIIIHHSVDYQGDPSNWEIVLDNAEIMEG